MSASLILLMSVILVCFYFLIKNNFVYSFRLYVLNLSYNLNVKKIKKGLYQKNHDYYNKLPPYESMLFSFKRLKLESYFTQEEIKELLEVDQ